MTFWEKNYERIIKLNKLLDEMRGKQVPPKDNMKVLMDDFGLTYDDAIAWLEQEPNYFTVRRIFTRKDNRRGLDRTLKSKQKWSCKGKKQQVIPEIN